MIKADGAWNMEVVSVKEEPEVWSPEEPQNTDVPELKLDLVCSGALTNILFPSAFPSSPLRSLPGKVRSKRFSHEETALLMEQVKARHKSIYGDDKKTPKTKEVRRAWDQISALVSSVSGIVRTPHQCRKHYNDFRRRTKLKNARSKTPGSTRNPTEELLTPAGAPARAGARASARGGARTAARAPARAPARTGARTGARAPARTSARIGARAPTRASASAAAVAFTVAPSVAPAGAPAVAPSVAPAVAPSVAPAVAPSGGPHSAVAVESHLPEGRPLQLQQNGFDAVERELQGLRHTTRGLSDNVERLLLPLNQIASALQRLADSRDYQALSPPTPAARRGSSRGR